MRKKRRPPRHLFAKAIIGHCVLWGTAACFYALRIRARTGNDPTGTLSVILAFLGGELLLLCLRTVLREKGEDRTERKAGTAAGGPAER